MATLCSQDRSVLAEIHAHNLALIEVWRDYKSRHHAKAITCASAVSEYCQSRIQQNCRPRYVDALRSALSKFACWYGADRSPNMVTTSDLHLYLGTITPATSPTIKSRLSSWFGWMVRVGYTQSNPAKAIEPARATTGDVTIIDNQTAKPLLATALRSDPGVFVWYWLTMGLGIRRAEALRLQTQDITDEGVAVGSHAAKTRSRRFVAAPTFLRPPPRNSGALDWTNLRRRIHAIQAQAGVGAPPRNAARHTAATHLLNYCGSADQVALLMGNSPAILQRNYRGLIRPGLTDEWVEIWRSLLSRQ